MYRLNEFAKLIGKSVQTLQRWDREGIFKAHRNKLNRRYYIHDQYLEYIGQKASHDKKNIVYYRVSSSGQKGDLENQKKAIEQFCIAQGIAVSEWVSDIGSGLNYTRKNFLSLMEMVERGEVTQIIVAHKDRLVRFGFEWFESFCKNHGTKILVMNNESLSPEEEMTKDLLSIIHCFSSRLYGLRKYKKKIKEIIYEKDN
ncbi:MAG: inosine-5-monophosphate dehydrogenase [Bacteroidetes bacterium RIFCSPLOWO2_12_FULL_37_12]|nr:MAG: inosine-5-monophosphate dehydrogenase [Bacteroidetes bacterium RIFCSPLOWO2_12_FULL_37_12]